MDQPTNPPPLNSPEHIIGYLFVAVMGLVGGFFRGKFRMRRDHAKAQENIAVASAAAEPSLQKENIDWTEKLIEQYQKESEQIRFEARKELGECRSQLDKEREEKYKYMQHTLLLTQELAALKLRVAELERQIGKPTDIR